jgi:hypothetical protein
LQVHLFQQPASCSGIFCQEILLNQKNKKSKKFQDRQPDPSARERDPYVFDEVALARAVAQIERLS